MTFQPGDRVVCIDADETLLVLGNIYVVEPPDNRAKHFVYLHGFHKQAGFWPRRFRLAAIALADGLLESDGDATYNEV